MIKIIEYGTKTVAVCDECGCKFSYENEDTVTREYTGPLRGYKKVVICPQCHKEKIVEQTR